MQIKWINALTTSSGAYLPHRLPVDPTLHWANPPGGTAGRDTRATFTSTPGRYTGPVPVVTHVHGAAGVGDESDGYAEAWYLPAANDLPPGYAREGTWFDFFAAKASASYGASWGPGFAVARYPNLNRASTVWYHDHTLGMTRLNVYAGPAGFYIVRGGPDGDTAVRDARTGRPATLPGPAPREWEQLVPSVTRKYREIPIAIQDRSFDRGGALFYPDTRAFFDGVAGPYIPDSDVSPIWNPEFFGNHLMARGVDGADVDGAGDREPGGRRHRAVGALQRHRGRAPHPHPRGDVRGRQPAAHHHRRGDPAGERDPGLNPAAARAVGDRLQGHRQRPPRPGDPRPHAVHDSRPVRVALPHRRARRQRDDASYRIGPPQPGQPAE